MNDPKNKVFKDKDKYTVLPNWEEVDRCIELVEETLCKSGFTKVDVLTALCIYTIEIAYNGNITKPHLLNKISTWWEEFDNQVNQ